MAISSEHATTVEQAHIDAARANGIGGTEFLPTAGATIPDDYLKQGSEGSEVTALQERLAELGYRPGDADGRFDAATASAVMAFQKAEGLERDSIVGPSVEERLSSPQAEGPQKSDAGPRVEVDLDRQIMFVIDVSGKVTTVNVSTGSGRQFQPAEAGKGIVTAHTPIGEFIVQRSIDGNRGAPLGTSIDRCTSRAGGQSTETRTCRGTPPATDVSVRPTGIRTSCGPSSPMATMCGSTVTTPIFLTTPELVRSQPVQMQQAAGQRASQRARPHCVSRPTGVLWRVADS